VHNISRFFSSGGGLSWAFQASLTLRSLRNHTINDQEQWFNPLSSFTNHYTRASLCLYSKPCLSSTIQIIPKRVWRLINFFFHFRETLTKILVAFVGWLSHGITICIHLSSSKDFSLLFQYELCCDFMHGARYTP
jgi:hypothetical protein